MKNYSIKSAFIQKTSFSLNSRLSKILFSLILYNFLIYFSSFTYNIEKKIENDIMKMPLSLKSLNWINIEKNFAFLAYKYEHLIKNEIIISEKSPIWVMWYQGIKNAPQIIKSCISSIIINRAKHHVYIIDKYNIGKFLELPSYLYEKLNNKTISLTHFSDVVRMGLLLKYGGYWIDSTYFLTSPLEKVNTTFYTLKFRFNYTHPYPKFIYKWACNFMASSRYSFIAALCFSSLLFYWKNYNTLIDIFIFDYVIYIAYKYSSEFKKIIDELPYACDHYLLARNINLQYNKLYFTCQFNKLTYKKKVISTIFF